MRIRRTIGFFVLSLVASFFLSACGGGGDSAPPPPPPDLSPAVTTLPASAVTSSSAVLNGIVNPKGLSTTAWFEYSKDPALTTGVTTTTAQALGSGSTDNTITQSITGLDSGQTYYFRATAINSGGTKKGTIFTLNTLPLPTVTTNPATSITTSGAVLTADVNPNGLTTTALFVWGTDPTLTTGTTTTSSQSVGNGTASVAITGPLTGLNPDTTYYFRVEATNSAGTAKGTIVSFKTAGGVPTVTTQPATALTPNSAVLNAIVNPNALPTTAWFIWGTDPTLTTGTTTTSSQSVGSGTASVAVTAPITGLTENTTYYFRVAANNAVPGTPLGNILQFTTPFNPPPTADAGPDQTVFTRSASGPTLVTLDATGSSPQPGGSITSYQWTQISGTAVTLDNSNTPTPSFSAPQFPYGPGRGLEFQVTVTDNRGFSATDNVLVTVNWGFFDDFSTDTTGTYTVAKNPDPNSGSLSYDAVNGKAKVVTGTGNIVQISHTFNFGTGNSTSEGVFTMDMRPTLMRAGSGVAVAIGDSADTYIRVSTYGDVVEKYRAGVLIDSSPFTANPTQNVNSQIKITFNRTVTTVEAFGQTVTMTGADNMIPMAYFSVSSNQLDALYDNFKLEIRP